MTALPVVCGVDGSDASREAAAYAAGEALARQVPLRIVHASAVLEPGAPPPTASGSGWKARLRHHIDELLADAVVSARTVGGRQLTVDTGIVSGTPAGALVAASREAALVVVGSRGLGTVTRRVVGSTSVQVVAHAHSPVIVVRHATVSPSPWRPVVVGVDGPASRPAVDFAFATANLHQAPLVAVHAWTGRLPTGPGRSVPLVDDSTLAHDIQVRRVVEELVGPSHRYPDVTVEPRVVEGSARRVLRDASSDARLLVVGSRGRGGFLGLRLGSVSYAMLHDAHCPVAVVRSPQ